MINVVIGANYGDEGKGQTVDYLVRQYPNQHNAVIRFNGGAQAGHTVVLPDGRKHIFSHFGAGTFAGADTILSSYFVTNPVVFSKELRELNELNFDPIIYVDIRCLVTTPYDVAFNRAIERKRGANKHGSVGIGFGETLERSARSIPITIQNLNEYLTPSTLKEKLQFWVIRRSIELGVDIDNDPLVSNTALEEYCYYAKYMLKNITSTFYDFKQVCNSYDNLVFEGAQGLLLDMEYGDFPHVTRSNCGLRNVVDLIGVQPMDVYYVTRSYMTRHGAGPIGYHREHILEDDTNKNGEWQGNFRRAPLNMQSMFDRCILDTNKYNRLNSNIKFVETWAREYNSRFTIQFNGRTHETVLPRENLR